MNKSHTWKPNNGELYYVPDITAGKKYGVWRWFGVEIDQLHCQRGIVFKTSEEAIAVADEIISKCKERMKPKQKWLHCIS